MGSIPLLPLLAALLHVLVTVADAQGGPAQGEHVGF